MILFLPFSELSPSNANVAGGVQTVLPWSIRDQGPIFGLEDARRGS